MKKKVSSSKGKQARAKKKIAKSKQAQKKKLMRNRAPRRGFDIEPVA